jgi:dimethylhistidine N-methyltransferase
VTKQQLAVRFDEQFAQDVLRGLASEPQKWLSAQYFYDEVGSALFEAITALPEYGLTRADSRLLRQHAGEMIGFRPEPLHMVELGSGSGAKTRWLLEAETARHGGARYTAIDVSAAALEACRAALGRLPEIEIKTEQSTYLDGVRAALRNRRPSEQVLVLFLGSTIGNFPLPDAVQLLIELRGALRVGDGLLLGTDLIKPVDQLLLAYDDPAGVTAAFNRNLLAHINRELRADFDLRSFEHEVRFDPEASRIEMHLRSVQPQTVWIEALDRTFRFEAGETIWTESSRKFTLDSVRQLAAASGFECRRQWVDSEWPFAESLLIAE